MSGTKPLKIKKSFFFLFNFVIANIRVMINLAEDE